MGLSAATLLLLVDVCEHKVLCLHPALLSICYLWQYQNLIRTGQLKLTAGWEWLNYTEREVEVLLILQEEHWLEQLMAAPSTQLPAQMPRDRAVGLCYPCG